MTHALKTWPEFYKEVESERKNFEIRRNDRPFKVGDTLLLQEWDNKNEQYTGKELTRRITYILSGDVNKFGLFADFCIMSLERIEQY